MKKFVLIVFLASLQFTRSDGATVCDALLRYMQFEDIYTKGDELEVAYRQILNMAPIFHLHDQAIFYGKKPSAYLDGKPLPEFLIKGNLNYYSTGQTGSSEWGSYIQAIEHYANFGGLIVSLEGAQPIQYFFDFMARKLEDENNQKFLYEQLSKQQKEFYKEISAGVLVPAISLALSALGTYKLATTHWNTTVFLIIFAAGAWPAIKDLRSRKAANRHPIMKVLLNGPSSFAIRDRLVFARWNREVKKFMEDNLIDGKKLPPGEFISMGITTSSDLQPGAKKIFHAVIFGDENGIPKMVATDIGGGQKEQAMLGEEARKLGVSLDSLRIQVEKPIIPRGDAEVEAFLREKRKDKILITLALSAAALPVGYLAYLILNGP